MKNHSRADSPVGGLNLFADAQLSEQLSGQLSKQLFELSHDLICITDVEGNFKSVNPAFERALGFTADELKANSFSDFIHPGDFGSVLDKTKPSSLFERSRSFEIRYCHKDGTYRWLTWNTVRVGDIIYASAQNISVFKNAQKALLQSLMKFKSATKSSLNALILFDHSGEILSLNRAAETVFGYSESDVVGTKLTEFMPERFRERGQACIERFLLSNMNLSQVKNGLTDELLGLRKDGSEFEIDMTLAAWESSETNFYTACIWNRSAVDLQAHGPKAGREVPPEELPEESPEERPDTVRGVAPEVRREIPAEVASDGREERSSLIDNEAKFSIIFENSHVPILVCNVADFRIREVNQAWCALFGFSKEDVCAEGGVEIESLLDRNQVLVIREKIRVSEILRDFETTAIAKDGREILLSINASTFNLGEQKLVAFTQSDITVHRRLENQLLATFNQNAIGIVHTSPELKWTKLNSRFCELVGYSEQELMATNFRSITHPEDAGVDNGVIEKLVAGETKPSTRQKRYIKKDGTTVWANINTTKVAGLTGKTEYLISFIEDISERKKAESEARNAEILVTSAIESSRLKSEFLAVMSHEIRTPINGVLGMTGLLLDTELNSEQRDFAETIRRSGESLLTVINDILDFSKIEAGKLEFESVDFDLIETVLDAQKMITVTASKKELGLVVDLSEKLPRYFKGDPGRLTQIFLNLLGNAVKFTSNGQIKIRGELIKEIKGLATLRFEIQDSGIGIPAAAVARMFKAFSQADASTSRRFGGTGLGLSISKKLVEAMSGRIGVESTEGVGSVFWFEIELQTSNRVQSKVPVLTKLLDTDKPKKSFRILVVEDNQVNQIIAVKVLQKMGLRAEVAGNGKEALECLRTIPYDLVLMDCQMPEMDGYEATRAIRNGGNVLTPDIPILAMTANAMSGSAEECIAAGMNGYLTKPIEYDIFSKIINEWLSNHESKAS